MASIKEEGGEEDLAKAVTLEKRGNGKRKGKGKGLGKTRGSCEICDGIL